MPHSSDREYAEHAVLQYEVAVRAAGGEPVRIELEQAPGEVMKQTEDCDAVLLPGSRADVNPEKYNAAPHQKTAAADARRNLVDELLLEDAYKQRKPVLAICYGLQSLNVYRSGSLAQHIESTVNHSAGRAVPKAHTVEVEPGSQLARIAGVGKESTIAVNSSHHQSADVIGDGLRIVARSPEDGIVEALEGTATDHFVLAVQWHPERSVNDAAELAEPSRAIFEAFVEAARAAHQRLVARAETERHGART